MPGRVSVIIPFYQNRSGILSRAVRSALAQKDADDPLITVVDNLSPVPAMRELADLMAAYPARIRVVTGPRRGPGAARNTGLDALGPEDEFIAFLDSDDQWDPNHLRNALEALEQGFDFYFSDFFHLEQSVSAFHRAGGLDPARHRRLGPGPFHEYRGDMFAQVLTANVIGTSTVVYRRRVCPDGRFDEDYSHAGEDYLFWLEVSKRTSRFVFSAETECRYGEGVNVYSGSGWGTEGSLQRTSCEVKYHKAVASRYRLGGQLAAHNRREVRRLRRYFVADLLHRLIRREPMDWTAVARQLRVDPGTGILFGPLAVSIGFSALKARAAASMKSSGKYPDTPH